MTQPSTPALTFLLNRLRTALDEGAVGTAVTILEHIRRSNPDLLDQLMAEFVAVGMRRPIERPIEAQEGRTMTEYTHPDVFTIGVRDGWADPETDPTRIDWAARRAAAAIPFDVIDGRPVNPCERTAVRHGRNELGHWGEALAADALVSLTDTEGHRWIVMIERTDGHGWALPGGFVDPGETAADAAVRELREETGLQTVGYSWCTSAPRYVPDPRASDEAWMVTVLSHCDHGTYSHGCFPDITGADDASRAAWVLADTYETLTHHLAAAYDGTVFAAHRQMLTEVLDGTR